MRFELKRYTPWVLALTVYALYPSAFAQTFVTPTGEAQNVRFEQREEGLVHIFYDLIASDPRAVFSVRVEASSDGGATFGMRPQTATGDVGAGVIPGVGKRIVWAASRDVERVQLDRFRFRIVATGGPLAVEVSAPRVEKPAATTAAPTAAPPTAPASTGKPQTEVKKKGVNPLVWVGAAGAVAGGAALALGGKGSQPPPPSTATPTTPTAATLNGTWSGTLPQTTSVQFALGQCVYTQQFQSVAATIAVSGGVVSRADLSAIGIESVAPGCPNAPYGSNRHAYLLVNGSVNGSNIQIEFRQNGGAPAVRLVFTGTIAAASGPINGTLRWERTLQSGEPTSIGWAITATITLTQ